MKRTFFILLWLVMGATFLVASVPENSYASALTYNIPKIAVAVAQTAVLPGATQMLDIHIDELAGRRTSLILVVNYPNGETVHSLHYVDSGQGTIAWQVPADAGVGEATFRLIADGCACGEHNTIPRQPAVDGTVEGLFVISAAQ